ncbi:MAG: NAD(P)H-dependent glycerol-3-phosphate dehydrogenase [Qingshengfaniella sp.]
MIGVLGNGAFGTALAMVLARDGMAVTIWGRDRADIAEMARTRRTGKRLPDLPLPEMLCVTPDLAQATAAPVILLALPMQALGTFLAEHRALLNGKWLVACCKGVDLATLAGPSALIARHCPTARSAVLTGPSFAADIASGLPTALTLATTHAGGVALQRDLSASALRIYLSDDPAGAEIGGALKNVVAIACGATIGTGLGESARAAVMTRGYAEMQRFAAARGARPDTLSGLSGFGDLALTAMSEQSRNTRFGLALGRGTPFDGTTTVEGAATATAVARIAAQDGLDMPLTTIVADLIDGRLSVPDAVRDLMTRPLKKE